MSRQNYLYRMRVAAVVVVTAVLLAACASMGRPTGGPRDVEPPKFVRSTPTVGALDVDGNKITVEFDENIQLDDPQQKIVISPAQKQTPQISSNGRRVTIELRDTLIPNTTYTIDFADAVKDLNEGNVFDGFAIDFSTGRHSRHHRGRERGQRVGPQVSETHRAKRRAALYGAGRRRRHHGAIQHPGS